MNLMKFTCLFLLNVTGILCYCANLTFNTTCSKEFENICVQQKSDHTKPDPSNLPMLVKADVTVWVPFISNLRC